MKEARGIRNNNPLNIRHSSDRWEGARMEQTDKSFVQFECMAYGYRAAWKVLESYWKYYKNRREPFTVGNIIKRWAPPSENDTESYICTVLKLTSLGGNELMPRPFMGIALEKLGKLLVAMTVMECGISDKEVDEQAIWDGYDLAFPGKRLDRKGRVRSMEPLMLQPVPLPDSLEKSCRDWDEYFYWSPMAHWG
ncbi:MAG: hypothetical protein IKU64_07695 [Bacteroides sp.]|nr:hypothetical protein [Bacteroides sp.]